MQRLAIAVFAIALGVLLPSQAWARPFAGLARGVCEPLETASQDGSDADLCCTDPSCEAELEAKELDLTLGWAPLCEPSGASGATRVMVYEPRQASIAAGPCDSFRAIDGALIGGDDHHGAPSKTFTSGWAILPDDVVLPPAWVTPLPDRRPPSAGGARAGFPTGVYRPPLG